MNEPIKSTLKEILSSNLSNDVINKIGLEFINSKLITTKGELGGGKSKKELIIESVETIPENSKEIETVSTNTSHILNEYRKNEEKWINYYRIIGISMIVLAFIILVLGTLLSMYSNLEIKNIKDVASILSGFIGGTFSFYYYNRAEKKLKPIIENVQKIEKVKAYIEFRKIISNKEELEKIFIFLLK